MLMKYLRAHLKNFVLYLGFAGIYLLVFYLDGVSVASLRYATLLAVVLAVLYTVVNFCLFWRKHRRLQELSQEITTELGSFPEPTSVIEQDYQDIVGELFAAKARTVSQYSADYQDMIDYYTLWVHQVKVPIAAMRLLLQSQTEEERLNLNVKQELKMELFRIEQYADMVLSYLRLDSEVTDYQIEYTSLDEVIQEAVKAYATMFILKKIRMVYQPVNRTVLTDRKWLTFVLKQLLSNALKYTPAGQVSIYTEQREQTLWLLIADSGLGIRAEDIPRLFEKGFTGYNGRMEQKSSGLGLYLCKRIIANLGYEIQIESRPGAGTKVIIKIPEALYLTKV